MPGLLIGYLDFLMVGNTAVETLCSYIHLTHNVEYHLLVIVLTVSAVVANAVELRWSRPAMENKWLPAARAGHSAVSLQLGSKNPPSTVVVFGGYNGQECFNDVLIFDCGKTKMCTTFARSCWFMERFSTFKAQICPEVFHHQYH